jgi:hypothetical protein
MLVLFPRAIWEINRDRRLLPEGSVLGADRGAGF